MLYGVYTTWWPKGLCNGELLEWGHMGGQEPCSNSDTSQLKQHKLMHSHASWTGRKHARRRSHLSLSALALWFRGGI